MKELLTTHDGVKVYDCQTVWVIRGEGRLPEQLKILDNVFDLYKDKGYTFFSNELAAYKYLVNSKNNRMNSIIFSPYPVPVIVESDKEGYLLYVQSGEQFENDIWTVVHCEGGIVRHYRTDQIRIFKNATFDLKEV